MAPVLSDDSVQRGFFTVCMRAGLPRKARTRHDIDAEQAQMYSANLA